MKIMTPYAFIALAALMLAPAVHAQDELDVTLEAVPADASADAAVNAIELPEAAEGAPAAENARFGHETANRARQLRQEMDQNFGEDIANQARERVRERIENMERPAGRP